MLVAIMEKQQTKHITLMIDHRHHIHAADPDGQFREIGDIMKQRINEQQFIQAFKDIRPYNFSDLGLHTLWTYFEDYDSMNDEETDLDVIAICCEFSEYDSLQDLKQDYKSIETMADLEENTLVLMIDESAFIIGQF